MNVLMLHSGKAKTNRSPQRDSKRQVPNENQPLSSRQCEKCGTKWHPKKQCPAYGKQCHSCGKHNHFAKLCKSKKKVQTLMQTTETDTLFIDAITKGSHTEIKSDTQGHKQTYYL